MREEGAAEDSDGARPGQGEDVMEREVKEEGREGDGERTRG